MKSNKEIFNKVLKELLKHRYDNGLFPASTQDSKTGYDKIWIRDNSHIAMAFYMVELYDEYEKTLNGLYKIFSKHNDKIEYATYKESPKHAYQYIHARYDKDLNEIYEEWGNKQNDAIGLFLYVASFEKIDKIFNLLYIDKAKILQNLIFYLESVKYYESKDNGVWEEGEKLNYSSLLHCINGIVRLPKYHLVLANILKMLNCEKTIKKFKKKDLYDLSILTSYEIINNNNKLFKKTHNINKIIKCIETLERDNGVIRYVGDKYYANENGEAEWVLGLIYLALYHKNIDEQKHKHYKQKVLNILEMTDYKCPELFYSGTDKHNENTPLLWAQALCLVLFKDD